MTNVKSLTWYEIEQATSRLIKQLRDRPIYGIVSISRGGLVPTAMIANHFGIHSVRTLALSTYNENGRQKGSHIEVHAHPPMLPPGGKHYICIDDIVDTGQTMEFVKNLWPLIGFATLYQRSGCSNYADYIGDTVNHGEWIEFPWEKVR